MFNAVASESGGEWYLGVYCRKCQAPIPVFQDPGRGTAIAAGSGKLTVACPRCGKKAQYAAREVITFLVYADRPGPSDRAPVNDDHPIDRDTPGSDSKMSEPETVLDLAPYEIPDLEPEPDVALDQDSAPEPETAEEPPVDEATVVSTASTGEAPVSGGDSAPVSAEAPVLELGPFEITDLEPEPVAEPEPEVVETESVPEQLPAAEIRADILAEMAEPPKNQEPGPDDTPVSEIAVGGDHPVEGGMPVAEAEPVPPESVEREPIHQPDLDAALELEAFFDASPVREAAPTTEAEADAVEIAEPAEIAEPEASDTLASDVSASEPVLELVPPESSGPEPVHQPDLDAAFELEAFFDASPVREAAPTTEGQADTSRIVEPAEIVEPQASDTLAPDVSAPGPALELVPHERTEPVVAPESERAPDVDGEPVRELGRDDAALELEAFFDASPVPTPSPETTQPTGNDTLREEPVTEVSETPADDRPVELIAPSEPALELVPHDEPEPEPVVALEPKRIPEGDGELARQPELDELEAFFDASPVPTPAVETRADGPETARSTADDTPVSEAPAFEEPAPEIVPIVAPVEAAPAPSPPAAAAPPATPKPIAVVYRERWAEPANRPRVIAELRPLLHGLKARAEAERHDVLVRVTDLFVDYLVEVAPERQSGVAIEQYIHAVFALSTRGRQRGTDRMGEEMAATLRALNRHAGLYMHR
jgi:hypothetical protein